MGKLPLEKPKGCSWSCEELLGPNQTKPVDQEDLVGMYPAKWQLMSAPRPELSRTLQVSEWLSPNSGAPPRTRTSCKTLQGLG